MKYKDDFLGSGKASEKKISNFIPKNRRLLGTKWVFKPILKYEYSVDNLDYTGNRIRFTSFDINYEREHKAKREISAYPVGKKVSVFYNPNNPTDSVLVVGVGSRVYMGFGLGILLLAIGGIFVKSDD